MGLFARLASHETRQAFSLRDPALAELFGAGRDTLAGPVVNEVTALTCMAFWDGVQQISADVAKQPLNLHQRLDGGGNEILRSSPTHRLMRFSPNPETRSMVFRRTITSHALVYGNGYAEIVRDGVGRPSALWMLHPTRVQPFFDDSVSRQLGSNRTPLRYRIDGQTVLDASDVLHLAGLSDDSVAGFNLVGVARETIGLCMASSQFASAFFGNGTRFGGILSSDQDIDEQQAQEIQAQIDRMHAKADKAFRMLILGAGFSFESAGTTPTDAQMKEIRDQQVTEVARALNMPLFKLKLNTPGAVSYNSVEMAMLDYFKSTLLTWITTWEEELNAKLVPRRQLGRQFFKHNMSVFLRGDSKTQAEVLSIAMDRGVLSANEWRDKIDLNPQQGDQGEMFLVKNTMVPKDQIGQMPADLEEELERVRKHIAETRSALSDKRTALAEAEENNQTTIEERDGLAADVERLEAEQLELETLEVTYREKEEELQSERDAAVAAAHAEREGRESADRSAEEASEKAAEAARVSEDAKAALEASERERNTEREAAEAAESAREEAEKAATASRAAVESAESALREAQDAANASMRRAEEAEAARQSAEAARDEALQGIETARADADQSAQKLESLHRELGEAQAVADLVEPLKEESAAAHERLQDVEARLATVTAESESARETLSALETRVVESQTSLERADAALRDTQAQATARSEAVIAAHRGLVLDAMGRMVRRECEQARSKQATPEKLRRWLRGFPEMHRAICVEAILPAVRVHMAWIGDESEPQAVAEGLVSDHIEAFVSRLSAVLESDPESFTQLLERALDRWERDAPAAVADEILKREINHVRS